MMMMTVIVIAIEVVMIMIPILVTLVGIVTDVSPDSWKAFQSNDRVRVNSIHNVGSRCRSA